MTIEVMEQALEALELYSAKHRKTFGLDGAWDQEITQGEQAITALRTAIHATELREAAEKQSAERGEPVAWMKEGGFRSQVTFDWRIAKREGLTIPLYSRPQLACAPTHEPVATMTVRHTKNKTEIGYGPASKGYDLPNGEYKLYTTPPAAQPAQEELQRLSALVRAQQITIEKLEAQRPVVEPHKWVHATEWRGLDGDEIRRMWNEASIPERSTMAFVVSFARAIEAKLRAVNGFSCSATEKNGFNE